ncbi:MAG: UvrD-helicase domain-containing protein [Clostridia bacterium]|nr:UvrD-helicase domain-containing protein [Clostridia bacterium]
MSIVDGLNDEQRLPVMDTEGAILVTAGAGSGKTRLLTHRIAYLILEKGVSPYNILAITFTNKAAREMRERVCRMVDNGEYIWVSTFHSLCVTILRREIDKLDGFNSKFSIYSDTEKSRVLKDIYADLGITEDGQKKSIEYHMSNIKNNNTTLEKYLLTLPDFIDEDALRSVYNRYTSALRNSNALDFDDLLVKTYELFTTHPDILAKYQDRFRYIHVDEFQDTNIVQYDIVSLLAKKWGNILVVGDEDQCIYGWRGANINNIMNFRRDFPNTHTYKLEQNYRSTKKILEKANMVISNNSQRLEKLLWTQNAEGTDVVYYAGDSDRQEAEFVIRTIINLVRDKGFKYSDCAILMRYSAPSRLFEEYMMQYNVPYKMLGGFKFFERVEIKNIIAYLRAVINPLDNESIARIINVPKRGIGESTINELRNNAYNTSYLSVLQNLNIYTFSPAVAKKLQSFADLYNQLALMSDKMPLSEYVKYVVDIVGLKHILHYIPFKT